MCMYMCMCIIICVHIYIYTHIYIYIYTYVYMCVCVCVVCVYVYIYVCIYTYMYTYFMCTYIFVLNIPIFCAIWLRKCDFLTEKLGIKFIPDPDWPDPDPKWFIQDPTPDPDPAKSSGSTTLIKNLFVFVGSDCMWQEDTVPAATVLTFPLTSLCCCIDSWWFSETPPILQLIFR